MTFSINFLENTVFTFTSLALKEHNVNVSFRESDLKLFSILLFCIVIIFFFRSTVFLSFFTQTVSHWHCLTLLACELEKF